MNRRTTTNLHLSWGGATHIGRVRSINQDALHAEAGLFAVADGMGGAQGGEVAAQMAVAELARARRRTLDELMAAIRQANQEIFAEAERRPELAGMGTTVVALAVVDGETEPHAALASVGDSRVYRWRDDVLEQLTVDHNYVSEMVRRGELSAEQAIDHPYRNMLTRAVGVEPEVMVDGRLESMRPGDRFVLCSDGLFNEVSDEGIGAVLRRLPDPTEAASELVRLANDAGGRDNVTAIVVDIRETAPPTDRAVGTAAEMASTTEAPPASVPAGDPPPGASPGQATGLPAGPQAGFSADTLAATADTVAMEDQHEAGPGPGIDRVALPGAPARIALFAVAVVGILVIAVGLIAWYARGAYYVAFSGDEVTIHQGRPGGVLWFAPTLEENTAILRSELTPASVDAVENVHETASLAGARQFVSRLALLDGPSTGTAPGAGTEGGTATTTGPGTNEQPAVTEAEPAATTTP